MRQINLPRHLLKQATLNQDYWSLGLKTGEKMSHWWFDFRLLLGIAMLHYKVVAGSTDKYVWTKQVQAAVWNTRLHQSWWLCLLQLRLTYTVSEHPCRNLSVGENLHTCSHSCLFLLTTPVVTFTAARNLHSKIHVKDNS